MLQRFKFFLTENENVLVSKNLHIKGGSFYERKSKEDPGTYNGGSNNGKPGSLRREWLSRNRR